MFSEILQESFLGKTVLTYLISVGIFLGGIIVVKIIKSIVLHKLKEWAKKTKTSLDDYILKSVEGPSVLLLYLGVLYFAIRDLVSSPFIIKTFNILGLIVVTVLGVRVVVALANYAMDFYWMRKEKDVSRIQGLRGMRTVIKFVIWVIAIALLLDNLGVRISALVAGLGIGGIAVALAAQAVLGDLFNFFAIFFDKPFEIGDFIILDNFLGTIEHIGIKTTRVRSLSGEQLVFSNTDLTSSRVRNYKRMQKRRVLFKLGVVYQTTLKQIKDAPVIIKEIIDNMEDIVFDRAHFSSFGDFSLNIEVVYYILSSDYNKYMDVQQEINFKIKEAFEKNNIEFAYPTQTVYMEK